MFENVLLNVQRCQNLIDKKVSELFYKKGETMIRNNKSYKVFNLEETKELKEFVAYCKQNNKIMSRELLKAIEYYLQVVKKRN